MKISEIKIGSEYQLNRDYNSTFKKGATVIISNKSYGSAYFDNGRYSISPMYLNKIDNTKLAISKKITEKKKEIEELQAKLDFLKESGETKYNENTFKAFQTVKLLDNKKLTAMDKAKLISGLISK